jgi:hypothetical protein
LFRRAKRLSLGKALRLMHELGVMEGWVPACAGKAVSGLRRHGAANAKYGPNFGTKNNSDMAIEKVEGIAQCI